MSNIRQQLKDKGINIKEPPVFNPISGSMGDIPKRPFLKNKKKNIFKRIFNWIFNRR